MSWKNFNIGFYGIYRWDIFKNYFERKKTIKINTLVANSQFKKILKQIKTFKPKYYVVADKKVYRRLNVVINSDTLKLFLIMIKLKKKMILQ